MTKPTTVLPKSSTGIHGIYIKQISDRAERAWFRRILARNLELYPNANPILLELMTLRAVQSIRAYKEDNIETADRLDLMLLRLIREAGSTNQTQKPANTDSACLQVAELLGSIEDGGFDDETADAEW